ncbi:MAG: LD-carboxypeptidase [Candidatus Micrarchaeota archaeon]|nr:LD-carboxypeptidase [Candidatus Micrarchaeota archaeon]
MANISTLLPERLEIGDTIGVVAPSKPIDVNDPQVVAGIAFLEKMGFKILMGKHVSSSDPEEKAEDINSMFSDKDVKMVMFAKGGDTAELLFPFMDWGSIGKNPKIMCGYSDAVVLLNSFNRKLGLVTFHGNDLNSFGRQQTDYDRDEFINAYMHGKKGYIRQNGERRTVRNGKSSGRLLGGNLRCLLKLRGTEFWPDFRDSILFLESYKSRDTMMELFMQLKEQEVFDKINGVIVGFNYGMQVLDPKSRQMEDIILEMTKGYDFPILKVNDFGHMCSQTVLPLGIRVELDADVRRMAILEDFVR